MFPGNMGNMLKQAQQMQARMAKLKEELALRDVTASAGGGAVTVTASCDLKLKSVLELPCGVISQSQVQLGDQIHIASTSSAGLVSTEETP